MTFLGLRQHLRALGTVQKLDVNNTSALNETVTGNMTVANQSDALVESLMNFSNGITAFINNITLQVNSNETLSANNTTLTNETQVGDTAPTVTPTTPFNADGDVFNSIQTDCVPSNDPADNLSLCNVTAYRCTNSQTTLQIPYDYEVHFSPDSDIKKVLQYVEESMLEQLATEMNIKDCATSYVGRRLQSFSKSQLDRLTGASLMPRDSVDGSAEGCLAVLDDDSIASDTVCKPIKGRFTLYTLLTQEELANNRTLTPQEALELNDAVLSVVKQGMEDNLFLAPGHVEKVIFIGNRSTYSAADSQNSLAFSSLSIGLISGAAALVTLVLCACFYACFRFKRSDEVQYVPDTVKPNNSTGSYQGQANMKRTGSNASSLVTRDSLALELQSRDDDTASSRSKSHSPDRIRVIETGPPGGPSTFARSGTSFEAAMFDLDGLTATDTDLGNYNFSYEQGITAENYTFDNLYDDPEIPTGPTATYDDDSHTTPKRTGDEESLHETPRRALQMG